MPEVKAPIEEWFFRVSSNGGQWLIHHCGDAVFFVPPVSPGSESAAAEQFKSAYCTALAHKDSCKKAATMLVPLSGIDADVSSSPGRDEAEGSGR